MHKGLAERAISAARISSFPLQRLTINRDRPSFILTTILKAVIPTPQETNRRPGLRYRQSHYFPLTELVAGRRSLTGKSEEAESPDRVSAACGLFR